MEAVTLREQQVRERVERALRPLFLTEGYYAAVLILNDLIERELLDTAVLRWDGRDVIVLDRSGVRCPEAVLASDAPGQRLYDLLRTSLPEGL